MWTSTVDISLQGESAVPIFCNSRCTVGLQLHLVSEAPKSDPAYNMYLSQYTGVLPSPPPPRQVRIINGEIVSDNDPRVVGAQQRRSGGGGGGGGTQGRAGYGRVASLFDQPSASAAGGGNARYGAAPQCARTFPRDSLPRFGRARRRTARRSTDSPFVRSILPSNCKLWPPASLICCEECIELFSAPVLSSVALFLRYFPTPGSTAA